MTINDIKKLTSVPIGLGVGDVLSVCANIVDSDNSNDMKTNKILVILCKIIIFLWIRCEVVFFMILL